MTSALLHYASVTRDLARSLDQVSRQPPVRRESAYFLARIGDVKSVGDLMADRRLVDFALDAFGLGEMKNAKAFIRKILEGGRDDPRSLANSLVDPRYREFAEVFDFKRYGPATTAFERATTGVVDRYVRQSLEVQVGRQSEAARLALYFDRKAPGVNSVYDILGDRALAEVTRTALGLPQTFAMLGIDRQAEAIAARLDVASLSEPDRRAGFLEQFLARRDIADSTVTDGPASLIAGGNGPRFGLPESLLLAIQTLRR